MSCFVAVVIPFVGGIEGGGGGGNRLLSFLYLCHDLKFKYKSVAVHLLPLYGQRKTHVISGSHVLVQLLRGTLVFLY